MPRSTSQDPSDPLWPLVGTVEQRGSSGGGLMLLSGVHSFSTYPPLGLCHLVKAEIMPSLSWPLETYPCHSAHRTVPGPMAHLQVGGTTASYPREPGC